MKIIFVYVANEVYKHFWSLVLGSVKISECTRRYIVNINFNVFYSTLTFLLYLSHVFWFWSFYILSWPFFTYTALEDCSGLIWRNLDQHKVTKMKWSRTRSDLISRTIRRVLSRDPRQNTAQQKQTTVNSPSAQSLARLCVTLSEGSKTIAQIAELVCPSSHVLFPLLYHFVCTCRWPPSGGRAGFSCLRW